MAKRLRTAVAAVSHRRTYEMRRFKTLRSRDHLSTGASDGLSRPRAAIRICLGARKAAATSIMPSAQGDFCGSRFHSSDLSDIACNRLSFRHTPLVVGPIGPLCYSQFLIAILSRPSSFGALNSPNCKKRLWLPRVTLTQHRLESELNLNYSVAMSDGMPERFTPGTTDNYVSNEIIAAGLTAAEVWPFLNNTSAWPTYYSWTKPNPMLNARQECIDGLVHAAATAGRQGERARFSRLVLIFQLAALTRPRDRWVTVRRSAGGRLTRRVSIWNKLVRRNSEWRRWRLYLNRSVLPTRKKHSNASHGNDQGDEEL
jgi:hypothetical protein